MNEIKKGGVNKNYWKKLINKWIFEGRETKERKIEGEKERNK